MFFAKLPRHTRQNAITEGDLECILTRNCEGTEQLRIFQIKEQNGEKRGNEKESGNVQRTDGMAGVGLLFSRVFWESAVTGKDQ